MCDVLGYFFGSGSDRSGATPTEIVAPQRDGEANDGEPGYYNCPRFGTKPLAEPWITKTKALPLDAAQEFAWLLWWEANRRRMQMQAKFPEFAVTGPCRRLEPAAHVDPGRPGGRCCRLKTCPLQCGRHLM